MLFSYVTTPSSIDLIAINFEISAPTTDAKSIPIFFAALACSSTSKFCSTLSDIVPAVVW
jgi:hypothetical protein